MAAYYNEFDPFAAQWLRNLIDAGHLAPGDVDTRSIADVQPEDLTGYAQCHFFAGIGIWGHALRRVGWPDDRGIWSGSCPCQPFSSAGQGGGFDDERHLFPAWFHLITQRRPSIVIGEQVASKDGIEWFDLVSTDLESAGYAVGAADLCAAGFAEQDGDRGGFHLRQRLYFVAIREGLDDPASARHEPAGRRQPDQSESGERVPRLGRDGGGMADRIGAGLERLGRHGGNGDQPGRDAPGPHGPIAAQGDVGGMVDPDDARRGARNDDTPARQGLSSPANSGPSGMADDTGRLHGVPDNGTGRANANLVYCRDGKWRPVEPGASPLAYAVPRSMGTMRAELRAICIAAGVGERDLKAASAYRKGALRGFGNALDAETVVAFLGAALPLAP